MKTEIELAAELNSLLQVNLGLTRIIEAQQDQIAGLVGLLRKLLDSPTLLTEQRDALLAFVASMDD